MTPIAAAQKRARVSSPAVGLPLSLLVDQFDEVARMRVPFVWMEVVEQPAFHAVELSQARCHRTLAEQCHQIKELEGGRLVKAAAQGVNRVSY